MPSNPTNNFKFFEDGFLTFTTGSTTGGTALLRLSDITLSMSRDVDETVTFDNAFVKIYNPTFFSWNISCSGVLAADTGGESELAFSSSGDTHINGVLNGIQLVEHVKNRTTAGFVWLKLDASNYQKGKVIITSMEIAGSAGSKMTYSLELQGSGNLTKVTS